MIEIKPFERLRTGVLSKFVAVILVVTAAGVTYLAYEEYRSNRLALMGVTSRNGNLRTLRGRSGTGPVRVLVSGTLRD
jgi:hypothetical protein